MNKRRISQCISIVLLIHAGMMQPAFGLGPTGHDQRPTEPGAPLDTIRVDGSPPVDPPAQDPIDWNGISWGGDPGDYGGGFTENPGDNQNVKDASQGSGCGGSNPTHANPIVMSTGNKVEPEVDFTAEGELPLRLERTYNHYWQYKGVFGEFWVSNLDYSIVVAGDESTIYAQRPDGRRIRFNHDPNDANRWVEDKTSPIAQIRRSGSGTSTAYSFSTEDNFTEVYNGTGRITRRTNVNGISWAFFYDSTGKYLTMVRHSSGRLNGGPLDRAMTLNWTGNQLTSITAPDGSVFAYTYTPDAFGIGNHRLATASTPGAVGNPAVTTTYHYEDPWFPGGLTGKSYNGVRYSTFEYDSYGRAKTSQHAADVAQGYFDRYIYSYDGIPVSLPGGGPADPPGPGMDCNPVTHVCNELPRPALSDASVEELDRRAEVAAAEKALISMLPAATTSVGETNPLGYRSIYTYVNGRLTTTSGLASAHCPTRSSSRSYDSNGNDDQIKDFRGNITDYDYAANGQLTNVTEALGAADARTTSYTWDTIRNRPLTITVAGLKETTYTYSSENRIASIAVKNKTTYGTTNQTRTWNFQYTRWSVSGMLKQVIATSPLGTDAVTSTYSEDGDLLTTAKTINSQTYTTTYSGYDGMGRPATVVGPNGDRTDYAYYPGGRLKSVTTYPDGTTPATTTFKYTSGLLTTLTGSDGTSTTYTYYNSRQLKTESRPIIGGTATQTYTRDEGSNVTQVDVDLDGVVALTSKMSYDELGHVIARKGNHNENFTYTYDVNGNLATSSDSYSKATSYEYDALNRLKKSTNPKSGITQFTYDKGDHVNWVSDPRNKITTYSYDGFGQLQTEVSPDRGTTSYVYLANGLLDTMTRGNLVQSTYGYDVWGRVLSITSTGKSQTFVYDTCTNGAGRLCSAASPDSSFSYAYDKDGRVKSKVDGIKIGTTTTNYTTSYAYDSIGRRSTMTYPNNEKLTYAYSSGLPSSMTATIGGVAKNVVTSASYEPFGPLTRYTHGNGLVRDYGFDTDGRYTGITSKNGAVALQNLSYTYDYDDRLKTITNNLNSAWSDSFTYDELSRVLTASGDAYTYDANGNRLTKASVGATYAYSPGNRMGSAQNVWSVDPQPDSSVSPAYASNLTYDNAGNTTIWDVPSASFTAYYDYDAFNRMYRVRSKNGTVTTTLGIYGYNPASERTSKQDVAHGHNYSYIYGDGHALVAERQDTSQWTNYFWFGGQLVGMSRGGALYQIDNDHLGRPELITDANKAIAWQSDNDAFGEHRSSSTSGALSGTFHVGLPGQYFDTETNYWYNMNRYYVAEIGRYLQPDPVGLAAGTNPYTYTSNNPSNFVDPLGLYCLKEWQVKGAAGAFVGAVAGGLLGSETGPGALISGGVAAFIGGALGVVDGLWSGEASGTATGAMGAAISYGSGIDLPGGIVGGAVGGALSSDMEAAGYPRPLAMATGGGVGASLASVASGYLSGVPWSSIARNAARGGGIGLALGAVQAGLEDAIKAGNDCGCKSK